MVDVETRWSVPDHVRSNFFLAEMARAAVQRLDPQPGELILDVGCGNGSLSAQIAEAGAHVIGLDSSPDLVEEARARGIDAFVADPDSLDLQHQVDRFGRFDAVFSNAALHSISDPDAVATGIFAILKEGGRFIGEMGASGNLALLKAGIGSELAERGYAVVDEGHWLPSLEEFTRLYCVAGFTDVRAERLERPTELPDGIGGWVKAFRTGLMDVAMVPEWEREDIAAAIEQRLSGALKKADGHFFADYVRLRFSMRKPD